MTGEVWGEQNGPDFRLSSWEPVDLTKVLEGGWSPPRPTVGARTDSVGLFYPGKVHTVSSETEGGKSWLALSAAVDVMLAGGDVVYFDFEDDENTHVQRLRALQVNDDTIAKHFHYFAPLEPLGTGSIRDQLIEHIRTPRPPLAFVDGVTEAMVLHDLNPNDNKEISRFGKILPRLLSKLGPAVACLDHVTKAREGRGRYALGGVHKLNGLDGAAYVLENRTPFGIGLTGRSTIKIAKDRSGQLRRHALPSSGGMWWFGDLVLTSHDEDFAEIEICPPTERDETFQPTHVMAKVVAALAGAPPPLSGRAIQDRIGGRAAVNRVAIARLVDGGYISPSPHRILKPYLPEEEVENT